MRAGPDTTGFNAEQLRNLMANAKRLGRTDVYDEAFARLCRLLPGGSENSIDDPVAQAFWAAVHAAEELRTQANGRTTRLSRTRQKAAKDGIVATIERVVGKPVPSEGFWILKNAGMTDFLFESIVLRFPDRFSMEAQRSASERLKAHEVS